MLHYKDKKQIKSFSTDLFYKKIKEKKKGYTFRLKVLFMAL